MTDSLDINDDGLKKKIIKINNDKKKIIKRLCVVFIIIINLR